MIPDLPEGWQSALAAAGAILVVVLLLRWTGKILGDQSTRSASIVDRTFDLVDKIVAKDMGAKKDESANREQEHHD